MSSSQYTTAVDVWSVGCIFGELFGRTVLFQGRTSMYHYEHCYFDSVSFCFLLLITAVFFKRQGTVETYTCCIGKPADDDIAKIQNEEVGLHCLGVNVGELGLTRSIYFFLSQYRRKMQKQPPVAKKDLRQLFKDASPLGKTLPTRLNCRHFCYWL